MHLLHALVVVLLVAGSGVASPTHDVKDSQTRYDRYLRLLGDYFSKPRHAFNDEANWLRARRAIIEEFQAIAARVNKVKMEVQKFNSEVVVNGNVPAPVEGENIIVTFQGEHFGTGKDSILVIGAHYDSDANTHGIDDNGSGMVALLESARHLASAISERGARLLDTVIFVAFDVQKLEHEAPGSLEQGPGSYYFVQEKLGPMLNTEAAPEFRGAIILDSVLNFNDSVGSQILPLGFDFSFKEAYEYIRKNENKGHFLTMVTKEKLRSLQLDRFFEEQWDTVNPPQSTRSPLVTLEIRRTLQSEAFFQFLKQDHLAFWNYVQDNEPTPLPAILITDTGKFRGMSRTCQTDSCDVAELVNPHRLALLDHVVMTIDQFITKGQLAEVIVPPQEGKAAGHVTNMAAMTLTIITALLFC